MYDIVLELKGRIPSEIGEWLHSFLSIGADSLLKRTITFLVSCFFSRRMGVLEPLIQRLVGSSATGYGENN